MKDKTTHLYVDSHERTLILHSLVELKNALIRQGQHRCISEFASYEVELYGCKSIKKSRSL